MYETTWMCIHQLWLLITNIQRFEASVAYLQEPSEGKFDLHSNPSMWFGLITKSNCLIVHFDVAK